MAPRCRCDTRFSCTQDWTSFIGTRGLREGSRHPTRTEERMYRRLIIALGATLALTAGALADPIVGNWRTDSGETAAITGGGPFAITLQTGKHKGKRIGTMSPSGSGNYTGKITDPANDKTYSGKASVSGSSLKMSGCVMGGLICRTQNWKRM